MFRLFPNPVRREVPVDPRVVVSRTRPGRQELVEMLTHVQPAGLRPRAGGAPCGPAGPLRLLPLGRAWLSMAPVADGPRSGGSCRPGGRSWVTLSTGTWSACRSGSQPESERPLGLGTTGSRRWVSPAVGLSWALWGVGQHPWPLPTRCHPPSSWETPKHVSRHCSSGVGATVTPGCDPASDQQGQKIDSSLMRGGPHANHALNLPVPGP